MTVDVVCSSYQNAVFSQRLHRFDRVRTQPNRKEDVHNHCHSRQFGDTTLSLNQFIKCAAVRYNNFTHFQK